MTLCATVLGCSFVPSHALFRPPCPRAFSTTIGHFWMRAANEWDPSKPLFCRQKPCRLHFALPLCRSWVCTSVSSVVHAPAAFSILDDPFSVLSTSHSGAASVESHCFCRREFPRRNGTSEDAWKRESRGGCRERRRPASLKGGFSLCPPRRTLNWKGLGWQIRRAPNFLRAPLGSTGKCAICFARRPRPGRAPSSPGATPQRASVSTLRV